MSPTNLGSLGLLVVATLVATAGSAQAQDAAPYFKTNCTACHTIGGGRLTGPDLKGVTDLRTREWLTSFITNPQARVTAGDAAVKQMVQEARGVVMPTLGVPADMIPKLLDLFAAESALPVSQFVGPGGPVGAATGPKPMTQADIDLGRQIFMGAKALTKGGPACIACHQVPGVPALGGGRLGPDLTGAYGRLGGQAALTTWLGAPASNTMKPVFATRALTPEEAHALVSFLKATGARGGAAPASMGNFVLLGLLGMTIGLMVFDFAWKKRFRAVRRPLVRGAQ